jgi:hypothetical protein
MVTIPKRRSSLVTFVAYVASKEEDIDLAIRRTLH